MVRNLKKLCAIAFVLKILLSLDCHWCFDPLISDIEIAMAQTPKDVQLLAKEIGLNTDEIDVYGKKKAKVSLKILRRLRDQPNGKYVVVTG